jgi:hypothetical protein
MKYTSQEIKSSSLKEGAIMIRHNLLVDDTWLIRAVLAIYDNQTADEQRSESTRYNNGIGFNGADANILSSFAKQIKRHMGYEKNRLSQSLSNRQLLVARRLMPKYSTQLMRIVSQKVQSENLVSV